jgi:exopolyphosphatase/guanosine-5'-triphosphate,3'-diphosphate pyrophosphatase
MQPPDGVLFHYSGEFREVSPPARLVYTFRWEEPDPTNKLLSPSELRRAEILGRALLLGHRFSASVPEILNHARLRIAADAVRLEVLNLQGVPDSEAIRIRLRQLAKAVGVDDAEIVEAVD